MTSAKPIIEVKNYTKKYGIFTAVNNVSFTVDEGSIFALLGPNGAGKSTTINTLCTIFDKTEGELTNDNVRPFSEKTWTEAYELWLASTAPSL